MTRTISSMAEIIRVGGWGLRGLGYTYGVSERAVPLIAWTEAAVGGALRSIRLAEDEIVASFSAPKLERMKPDRDLRHVDAHGRHLIEVGPPAMDLVTADVRRQGHGALMLSGSIGSHFVPALANILAHRKLTGGILFRPEASAASSPAGGSCWLAFGEQFVSTPAPSAGKHAAVREWCDGSAARGDAGGLHSLLDGELHQETTLQLGSLRCLAWQPTATRLPSSGENLVTRVAEAWQSGVETTTEDLRYLYQLETRAWAPTSERSRAQAGYGKF